MIISVINLKGGSGKTTTAMALATAAARHHDNQIATYLMAAEAGVDVVDVACDVADFVIVPATQGPFELSHALETAESLDAAGKPYALLLLKVENNKLAGNAVNLIRERGASVFDASVPKRVGMQKVIGHAFPSNLNGYEDVYLELEEAIA